jgi:hypothetical protein
MAWDVNWNDLARKRSRREDFGGVMNFRVPQQQEISQTVE